MTRFPSCWCMIDRVLLKEGSDRWRHLRFFIHPIFLLPVELFIILQLLISRITNFFGAILVSLFFIFQIFHSGIVSVFLCCRTFIFSFSEVDEISPLTSEADTSEIFAKLDVFEGTLSTDDECKASPQVFSLILYNLKEEEDTEDEEFILCEEPPDYVSPSCLLEDYALADEGSSSPVSVMDEVSEIPLDVISINPSHSSHHIPRSTFENQIYEITPLPPSISALSTAMKLQQGRESRVEIDLFFEDYNTRMKWFDQLNSERRHAVSVISKVKLGTASLNDRIEPLSFSFPLSAHEKLAKSITSDFEVVYVGQACLSWEGLCHHYRKVKEISLVKDARCQGKVAEKFQQFQVLLERFTENERCQGKRFWNYAHTRFCNASLLQVPDVPGYVEDVRGDMEGESTKASMVLEAIVKAMGAFWLFLQCEINKKTCRCGILEKMKIWDCQVEDPRDLELFTSLLKEAYKKNMKVKKLLKKNRQMRKIPGEEIQVENLLCTVDINLVIRVLKMSVVTSAQIRWCHEKLNNMVLDQRAFRTTDRCLLFPYS